MELPPKPRILFYDIEATNLNADFGYILCIGYKWFGEKKAHVISINDFKQFEKKRTCDREILKAFSWIIKHADMVVYQYGCRYDEPFINTRCLIHNLPPIPRVKFLDTWKVARERLKLHSNRLATMIEAFNIKEKKTPLNGPIWIDAGAGYPKAIEYVKKHCLQDVLSLELVYMKIRALSEKYHPSVPMMMGKSYGCVYCGSEKIVKFGYAYTNKQCIQRLRCKVCGGDFRGGKISTYKNPIITGAKDDQELDNEISRKMVSKKN